MRIIALATILAAVSAPAIAAESTGPFNGNCFPKKCTDR